MKRVIAVIDYGAGNLHNVCAALAQLQADVKVVDTPEQLRDCDGVLFPGVGVWGSAVDALQRQGLLEALKEQAQWVPLVGICLGMQLLFEESAESPGVEGLGLLPGRVEQLPQVPGQRLPSIDWRKMHVRKSDLKPWDEAYFYFVHSFHAIPQDDAVISGTYAYGDHAVTAMVRQDNITGCQFHPEKSGEAGLALLAHVLELSPP